MVVRPKSPFWRYESGFTKEAYSHPLTKFTDYAFEPPFVLGSLLTFYTPFYGLLTLGSPFAFVLRVALLL
ncbi:hypothetical protein FA13DRAFT_527097 [Coprinellus micaceus]|jgi:hypothetical protein|uniref:Uncharacterized protein n=1 Tax=Coprinellus micaceus TaxID=71717 RepID=A0A4Y7T998_COPMI|nr:hypothetical protein FA13DRAFT_527097 [Coprinellus micaceus]